MVAAGLVCLEAAVDPCTRYAPRELRRDHRRTRVPHAASDLTHFRRRLAPATYRTVPYRTAADSVTKRDRVAESSWELASLRRGPVGGPPPVAPVCPFKRSRSRGHARSRENPRGVIGKQTCKWGAAWIFQCYVISCEKKRRARNGNRAGLTRFVAPRNDALTPPRPRAQFFVDKTQSCSSNCRKTGLEIVITFFRFLQPKSSFSPKNGSPCFIWSLSPSEITSFFRFSSNACVHTRALLHAFSALWNVSATFSFPRLSTFDFLFCARNYSIFNIYKITQFDGIIN